MTALDAFLINRDRAMEALAAIQNVVDNHFNYDPDSIDWTHAGTAGHIAGLLEHIRGIVEGK